jgi:prepilin peptidase CpaA
MIARVIVWSGAMLEPAVAVVFPLLVAYAAVTDFLTMTIANRVSILLVAFFLLLAPFVGMTPAAFGLHFAAAFAVFAAGYICFVCGWMGGGDVKFGAAVALWLGMPHLLEFMILFSLYGGALTLFVLVISKHLEPLPVLQLGFLAKFAEKRTVPYGIALAAAALTVYPKSIWVQSII